MGLVGIGARIAVGLLLDRFPANIIGTITMLMPAAGCCAVADGGTHSLS